MDLKIQLIIILSAAIGGISTAYWLQAAINNKGTIEGQTILGKIASTKFSSPLGVDWDLLTFVACIITSILSNASICLILMKNSNKWFYKISFALTDILCILWFACLIVYSTRNIDEIKVNDMKVEAPGLRSRGRDIVRSVIYLLLTGISAVFHFLSGVLKA